MFRIVRWVLLFLLGWIFLHCLWVVTDGYRDFTQKADIAIVMGNTVFADGSLSPWMQGRVDEALRLYRQGQVKQFFLSGGIGTSYYPEGDGMRQYLLAHGVPDSAMIVDNYGDNSYLTAKNFKESHLFGNHASVVVVTSFYHVTRSKYAIRKQGFDHVYGGYSPYETMADWYGLLREFPAFYKYMLVY